MADPSYVINESPQMDVFSGIKELWNIISQ